MRIQRILVPLLALPVLVVFQNCSDVTFDSGTEAQLVSKIDSEVQLNLPDSDEDNSDEDNSADDTNVVVNPPSVDKDKNINNDDSDNDNNNDVVDENNDDVDVVQDDGALNFICILEGPGKSVKLHLEESGLAEGTSTVRAVCTSESACLNIVSQKFAVKAAEPRGFCGKNKNTVTLTGADLMVLIGQ